MHEVVLRKRALHYLVTLMEQHIYDTYRHLSAILRSDMENLDLFWVESNLISQYHFEARN